MPLEASKLARFFSSNFSPLGYENLNRTHKCFVIPVYHIKAPLKVPAIVFKLELVCENQKSQSSVFIFCARCKKVELICFIEGRWIAKI